MEQTDRPHWNKDGKDKIPVPISHPWYHKPRMDTQYPKNKKMKKENETRIQVFLYPSDIKLLYELIKKTSAERLKRMFKRIVDLHRI